MTEFEPDIYEVII